MNKGLWKGKLLVLIISLYWKKDFQESTPKIQKQMFGLGQTLHFGQWDSVKYENTLMCKRISWDSGGMMF